MNKKLIVFDRDGCINRSIPGKKYVSAKSEFHVYKDVLAFFNNPISYKFNFAVATNQQGVGKELYKIGDVLAIHDEFLRIVGRESAHFPIFICPHLDNHPECDCRKPKPGLLLKALKHFKTDPAESLFIGNRLSDAQAAVSSGIDFYFLNREIEENSDIPESLIKFQSDSIDLGFLENWAK